MREKQKARWVMAYLRMHFGLWSHSLRTVVLGVFFLCVAFIAARSPQLTLQQYQYEAYHGELMFIVIFQGFNIHTSALALLLMLSEIPRRVSYQEFALLRTSRKKWLLSLIMFCLCLTVLMMLTLLLFAVMCTRSYASPGSGWSDLARLAADPYYIYEPQLIPEYIRVLTPLHASLVAAVVVFLFYWTAALIILMFSLYGTPHAGVLLCAALLFMDITVLYESLPFTLPIPTHYATLQAVGLQRVSSVCSAYLVIDTVLIVLMALRARRMDMQFSGKE